METNGKENSTVKRLQFGTGEIRGQIRKFLGAMLSTGSQLDFFEKKTNVEK